MNELSDYFKDINKLPVMPWQVSIRHLICMHRLRQEIKWRAKSEKNNWRREANLRTIQGIRQLLCEGNLRLVVSCAKGFRNQAAMMDLIAEGNLGLLSAIDNFAVHRKCRFSTYASCVIRTWIRNWTNSQTMVTKRSINQRVGSLVKAQQRLSIIGNHNPTDQELADWLNKNGAPSQRGTWKLKHITALKSAKQFQTHLSLEGPAGKDMILGDVIPDKRQLVEDMQSDIELVLSCLKRHVDAREADVVHRRFYHNTTLKEIGDDLGLTRERIRQIETATLDRVRAVFTCHRGSWMPLAALVGPGERSMVRAGIARWLSYPDPPPLVICAEADPETEDLPAAECVESVPTLAEYLTNSSLGSALVPCQP